MEDREVLQVEIEWLVKAFAEGTLSRDVKRAGPHRYLGNSIPGEGSECKGPEAAICNTCSVNCRKPVRLEPRE